MRTSRIIPALIFFSLLAFPACRDSDIDIQKVAAGEGYLLLDPHAQNIRVSVKEMEIYLVDPDAQDRYPEHFEITGPDLHLVGTFPMSVRVGYGEHFEEMLNRTIDIAASGNPSRRQEVDSYITLPGQSQTYVEGGTLQVTKVVKDNILQGEISLDLRGGKTLSGKFVFSATTWG